MIQTPSALMTTLCLSLLTSTQTPRGLALEAKAAALSAVGKFHDAGDMYTSAAKAYTAEGNSSAAAKAYGKAAELYEQEAAALLKSLDAPNTPKAVAPKVTPRTLPLPPEAPQPALPKRMLSPLAPRAGMLVGHIMSEGGGTVTNVSVTYSGFEDGKTIINHFENVSGTVKVAGGSYAIKVPPGAYRVSAYATYIYQGQTYNFELEPLNPPNKHDYDGLGLDKLRGGLVRDFVLKMTAKKAGASEETETVYKHAYYGGVLNFDCGEVERILGGGHTFAPPLSVAYPPDSRLLVTLTPQGPMVDGSSGRVLQINLRLGDQGRYTFSQRGIFPGIYTATAILQTPAGERVPVRLALMGARTVLRGSPEGYDMTVMDWKSSVTVNFLPNDLGPMPRYGVKALTLFPGK